MKVSNYRKFERGALSGFFDIEIESAGIIVRGCSHFKKDGKSWFKFPQKEVSRGSEIQYYPIVSLSNGIDKEAFNRIVIDALKQLSDGLNDYGYVDETLLALPTGELKESGKPPDMLGDPGGSIDDYVIPDDEIPF